MTIPASVDEVTPAWLSEVLDADVAAVEVVDAHSGTTGRAKIRMTGGGDLPETLFVKLQPFDDEQREFLAMIGLGVSEAKLYAAVGDELPVRVPKVWHSSYDDADDSLHHGARGPRRRRLPLRHARRRRRPRRRRVARRRAAPRSTPPTGARTCRGSAPTPSAPATAPRRRSGWRWAPRSSSRRSTSSPTSCRRSSASSASCYIARNRDIGALWNEGERTLIHGDDHIGNLFVDDGRTGFYDWAVACQLPGHARRRLLPLQLAADRGAPGRGGRAHRPLPGRPRRRTASTSTPTLAHEQYRLFSIYSWISATTTAAMGSKWQPAEVGRRATERTTQAIIDLDVLGLLAERLGPVR